MLDFAASPDLGLICTSKSFGIATDKPGGINFSILGRDDDPSLGREEYIKWDKERLERVDIADRLKNQFPDLEVNLGGQTGLDISDNDKSQILTDFNSEDEIHFFGDMMLEGQNDYPLAKALKDMGGFPHHVKNWEDTRTRLFEFIV